MILRLWQPSCECEWLPHDDDDDDDDDDDRMMMKDSLQGAEGSSCG